MAKNYCTQCKLVQLYNAQSDTLTNGSVFNSLLPVSTCPAVAVFTNYMSSRYAWSNHNRVIRTTRCSSPQHYSNTDYWTVGTHPATCHLPCLCVKQAQRLEEIVLCVFHYLCSLKSHQWLSARQV